jgi:GTPase SAR1 family protein
LRRYSNPDAKVILIGNKSDLDLKRTVPYETGQKYCNENQLDMFMETSAKLGVNVESIFVKASQLLYTDYLKYKDSINRVNYYNIVSLSL